MSTDPKFKKIAATEEETEQIDLLVNAISKLLHDDGSSPDLCRHVLLRMAIWHYKWNTDNGASKEEVGKIMWDEYSNILKILFEEDFLEMAHHMLWTGESEIKAHLTAIERSKEDLT